MKTISLKIDEMIFEETETILLGKTKSRNRYINEALAYYNKLQNRLLLERKLSLESKMVQESYMEIMNEFESIDYELQTI